MAPASTRAARTWHQPPAGSAAASIALAALAASGCREEPSAEPPIIDAAALEAALSVIADRVADIREEAEQRHLGEFKFTYYVIAQEPDTALTSTAATGAEASNPDRVAIHDNSCEPIAEVTAEFAQDLRLQGTGVLRDGRVVSASKRCDCDSGGVCFFLPGKRYRWGIGAANRSLSPFRSVAVDSDVVPLGNTLYVPELDGLTMPGRPPWGGFVHDGCVVADDRGGSVDGSHLDFFAARRGYYRALDRSHGLTSVTVYDGTGRCEHLTEGRRPAS